MTVEAPIVTGGIPSGDGVALHGRPFARENGIVRSRVQGGTGSRAAVADPKAYAVFGTPVAWPFNDGVNGSRRPAVEGIGLRRHHRRRRRGR